MVEDKFKSLIDCETQFVLAFDCGGFQQGLACIPKLFLLLNASSSRLQTKVLSLYLLVFPKSQQLITSDAVTWCVYHIQRCKLTLMSNHGWSLAREPLRRRGDAIFFSVTWCRDQDSSLAVPNSSSTAAWSRPCAHVTILEYPVSNLCLCLTYCYFTWQAVTMHSSLKTSAVKRS